MRRLIIIFVAVAASSFAMPAGQAMALNHRVLGGVAVGVQSAPWQVAIWAAPPASAVTTFSPNPPPEDLPQLFNYACGGVILDATHVLTAAHCINVTANDFFSSPFDRQLFAEGPWTYGVAAGTSFIGGGDAFLASSLVKLDGVARDPMYDGANYDVAVLTLADPLPLDGVNLAAIGLSVADPATGTALTVTGWGQSLASPATTDTTNALQSAPVHVTDFAGCQKAYGALQVALTAGASLCAAGTDPVRGDCARDAGGPLVNATPTQLVGIYSSGLECGQAQYPGVYTSVANPAVQQFIADQIAGSTSGSQPSISGLVGPALTGVNQVGQTLTCTTGVWNPAALTAPVAYKFTFFDPNAGVQLQTATGTTATYTVLASDAGRDIACSVRAANLKGAQTFLSNPLGPEVGLPGTGTPGTGPGTGITGPPPAKRDTTKPRAVVTSTKCSPTKCVLHVTAQDNGFSAGIKSLTGTVKTTTTTHCGTKTCTHTVTQKLKITKLKTSGYYLVTASKLPRGKHRFSLVAVDKAGNKQSKATVKTVTTSSR